MYAVYKHNLLAYLCQVSTQVLACQRMLLNAQSFTSSTANTSKKVAEASEPIHIHTATVFE